MLWVKAGFQFFSEGGLRSYISGPNLLVTLLCSRCFLPGLVSASGFTYYWRFRLLQNREKV